jgi:hypothetical protein
MKTILAISVALSAVAVQAQPTAQTISIQPSVDTAEERLKLRTFTACLADQRTRWARRTLAAPYLSEDQARAAAEALTGRDTCLRDDGAEMTFRTSTLISSLAEHFLRADLARVDFQRVVTTMAQTEPLNVSEDFALCVASRDPVAARDLALSEPGSTAEAAAAQRFQPHLRDCMKPGEPLTVDLQALRALMTTALYRAVTASSRT